MLLPKCTSIAVLLDAIDTGQAAHHAALGERVQCTKVEVTKTCMPPPCDVLRLAHEARWHIVRENAGVEAIPGTLDAGEQLACRVADRHQSVVDADLVPALVELPHRDDVAPQAGDVVRVGEDTLFASLPAEDDGSLSADVDDGAVAEPHGAMHRVVELGEDVA
jgi:hypothetical protein